MGKVADLTPKKRSVIVALAKEKLSYSAIAERVRCSKATVSKTLKLVNETGGVASRKRSGRPRCTSHRDDLAMLKTIKKQPFLTAADLKASQVKSSKPLFEDLVD
jgi:transposase